MDQPQEAQQMAGQQVYIARFPGLVPYHPIWQGMRHFSENRSAATLDEFWLLQHQPVFTQGQAGRPEHLLLSADSTTDADAGKKSSLAAIPVVNTDRGGQVTYHGPGQVVVYTLLDIGRLGIKVKELVFRLEAALIATLAHYRIVANRRPNAPGVYLGADGQGAKIASLGLRIRRGMAYHGIALNVDMDLSPFSVINPCGYPGLAVSQLSAFCPNISWQEVGEQLCVALQQQLGLTAIN